MSREFNERRALFNGDARLAQRSYEEEEVQIEVRSKDLLSDFKSLMRFSRLLPAPPSLNESIDQNHVQSTINILSNNSSTIDVTALNQSLGGAIGSRSYKTGKLKTMNTETQSNRSQGYMKEEDLDNYFKFLELYKLLFS